MEQCPPDMMDFMENIIVLFGIYNSSAFSVTEMLHC